MEEKNNIYKVNVSEQFMGDYESKYSDIYKSELLLLNNHPNYLMFAYKNENTIYELTTGVEFNRIDNVFYSDIYGIYINENSLELVNDVNTLSSYLISASKDEDDFNRENNNSFFNDMNDIYDNDCRYRANAQLLCLKYGKKFTINDGE